MIIELPVLPKEGSEGKYYKMGFQHFSNNNLSIRKQCAVDLGMYDPDMRTSEDVDICFRLSQSPYWTSCREPGVIIRHKARKTLIGMVKQLWGWGINLGRAYVKTKIKGVYIYWVSSDQQNITKDLEIETAPFLACIFLTNFHLAHLLGFLCLLAAFFGHAYVLPIGVVFALYFLGRFMIRLRRSHFSFWWGFKLAIIYYTANITFLTASVIGGLRVGVLVIPSSIFPPRGGAERRNRRDGYTA